MPRPAQSMQPNWQIIGQHSGHFIWAAFSVVVDGETHQPQIAWSQPQTWQTEAKYNVMHAARGIAVQAKGPAEAVRVEAQETVILNPSNTAGNGRNQTQRTMIYVAITANGHPPAADREVQNLQTGTSNGFMLPDRWNLSVTQHHISREPPNWQPRMMVQHEALFPGVRYCVSLSNLPWGAHWLGLHMQKPTLNDAGSLQEAFDEVVYLHLTVSGAVAGAPVLPPTWQNS